MFGGKQLCVLLLVALFFVVSGSAKPVNSTSDDALVGFYSTNATSRIESRTMGCGVNPSYPHIRVCRVTERGKLHETDFKDVSNILYNRLPDKGTYTYYDTCYQEFGTCVAMSTLSGSEFTPKNYQHVARLAVERFKASYSCIYNGSKYHSQATDIYMYEYNFLFSWWVKPNREEQQVAHCDNPPVK